LRLIGLEKTKRALWGILLPVVVGPEKTKPNRCGPRLAACGWPDLKKRIINDRVPFTHEDENGIVGRRSAGLATGVSS
jgi:hypothetical protein